MRHGNGGERSEQTERKKPGRSSSKFRRSGSEAEKTQGPRRERNERKDHQQGTKEPPRNRSSSSRYNNGSKHSYAKTNNIVCFRCGQAHLAPNCTLPRSVKCRECGGFEHLQKVCKKKGQALMLEEVCHVDEQRHYEHRAKFTVPLRTEYREIIFDMDCGSAVTLVS